MALQLHDAGLTASAHVAFVHGMNLVLVACGAIALLAAVLAARFLPGRSTCSRTVAGSVPEHAESVA